MSESNSNDLAQLRTQLTELTELIHTQTQQDNAQKQAFDLLYSELEHYKKDFIFQAEKPLLLDLLLFFDSLSWFKQSLLDQTSSREVLSESFQYLIDEFLELLYRRDVSLQDSPAQFDPKTQRAIQVIPTLNPEQDQAIDKVIKRGFIRAGKVLRPDQVAIHRYQSPDHLKGDANGGAE